MYLHTGETMFILTKLNKSKIVSGHWQGNDPAKCVNMNFFVTYVVSAPSIFCEST